MKKLTRITFNPEVAGLGIVVFGRAIPLELFSLIGIIDGVCYCENKTL